MKAEYNIATVVVLALETATRPGSAALVTGRRCDARVGDAARTHGERLPAELTALLAAHKLTPHDVERFAVVSGPGSFTGLRVGIAAIQGLALVTGRPVVAVPTLEAMAEGWRLRQTRRTSEPQNPRTPVIVCLDGQRGDVFFAAWRLSADVPIEAAEVLIASSVGTPADLVARICTLGLGPSAVLIGSGIDRHLATLAASGVPVQETPMCLAEAAAWIAVRRPDLAGPPHAVRPLYIRRPDAVLARERAGLARS